MKISRHLLHAFAFILSLSALPADEMKDRVRDAGEIFSEKQRTDTPIPPAVLQKAKGIAVVEITKGGLGVSGSHGEGVLLVRTKSGWSAPAGFSMGGGSVGFQIGFEVKRFIFVLCTQKAVDSFTSEDKIALDAKASATAGPDHVAEEATTLPDGDIYVYTTKSGGAFAGAAVGGQIISIDGDLNRETYGDGVVLEDILSGKTKSPDYARDFYKLIGEAEKKKSEPKK